MSQDVFLGVIALAAVVIAGVQVGVFLVAGRVARRIDRLADSVERDLKPVFVQLEALGRDASRASALAVAQVERVDRMFTDLGEKLGETLTVVQASIAGPAREGKALMSALRAVLGAIRDARANAGRSGRGDDEDALFI